MSFEDSFPRGNLPKNEKKSFRNENSLAFLQDGKRKRSYSESHSVSAKKRRVSEISYGKISEGMRVLACVRSITEIGIEVELPGKMCGKIKISTVSDPLTNLLQAKIDKQDIDEETPVLNKLFHIGQFIPTMVIKKELTTRGTKLLLSTNPKDIHKGWSLADFIKGRRIWAAVEEELEHGYQLSVGIRGCRIFLPFKNVKSGTKYVVGQSLYCTVRKSTIDFDASNIVVSTLEEHTDNVVPTGNMDFIKLTPGSCINFTVRNVLVNGLHGGFLRHSAFILEAYLDVPYEDLSMLKYNKGDNFKAFLLYVEPHEKGAYFTLRGISSCEKAEFANGSQLDCEVFRSVRAGVYIKLPNNRIGYVASKRLGGESYVVGSQQRARILDYRKMEQLYICTFAASKEKVGDETFNLGDLINGEVVNVVKAGVTVKFNSRIGFIQTIHLSTDSVEVGDVVQAKIWNIKNKSVFLTMKKGLLDSDVCLKAQKDAAVGEQYPGVVVHKGKRGILVVFYGDIKGILSINHLKKVFGEDAYSIFEIGEVIFPTIVGDKDILLLELNVPQPPKSKQSTIKIGDYVAVTVSKVCANGLIVNVACNNQRGFIPTAHLSACLPITSMLLDTYNEGDVIEDVLYLSKNKTPLFSIREAKAFRKDNLKIMNYSEVSVGSFIRGSVLKCFEDRIRILAPFIPESKMLHLYKNNLDKDSFNKYQTQQAIVSKVIKFKPDENVIKLTARSEEICKWSYDDSLDYLEQYLEGVSRLQLHLKDKLPMAQLDLGQRVQCTVKAVTGEKCLLLLENNVQGFAPKEHTEKNVKVGDSFEAVVLWKDFLEEMVILSLKKSVIASVERQEFHNLKEKVTVTVSILLLYPQFIIAATKKGNFVFVPVLQSNRYFRVPKYRIRGEINAIVTKKMGGFTLAIDELMLIRLREAKEAFFNKTCVKTIAHDTVTKMEVDNNESESDQENVATYSSIILSKDLQNHSKVGATLPGVQNFFAQEKGVISESSSDEDVEEVQSTKKKKKLTAGERAEIIRQAEERIRDKEIELADGTAEPQSEEQFERLVTGNPNSSELWAKYIAYCVSNAEIHKARNIAKAALKRIDFSQTEERYNIWITLLNLENSYGDKESFNGAFEEAVRCNDDLQIYLDVIDILATSKKYTEMNEKVKKVKNKYKQNPKMWTNLALIYYRIGELNEARNIRSSALKTIDKKSNHIDLIVQFAIMEFNYGERHHAEALFETIIQSNPKRVDVWCTYVDQMIKKANIEGARRLLERSVSQHLPPKKIKTLFKKYKFLEMNYGDDASIAHVVDLARQYVGDK